MKHYDKMRLQIESCVWWIFQSSSALNLIVPCLCTKVGSVFSVLVVSQLHHADFGPNDHREDAPHFIQCHFQSFSWSLKMLMFHGFISIFKFFMFFHIVKKLFFLLGRILRVVQTQAILFLKSMSERVGSDI